MKKLLAGVLLGALLAVGMTAPSMAQVPGCGYMVNGSWVSNGNCDTNNHPWMDGARHPGILNGRIVNVNGNIVTVRTWHRGTITFNDRIALRRQMTGQVAVGRVIQANGFWRNGMFQATSIQ